MSEPPDLERHRPALLLWAKCQLPEWLRGKLDPEDLVNQVLLEAHAARDKLAAMSDDAARAYLRRALCNDLIDAARKHARARSDVSPDDVAQSSVRLADWLEAAHTSPSERAARNEQFERRYLVWLLRRADGNISKAARDADMDRKYLHKLLKKYEIDPGGD